MQTEGIMDKKRNEMREEFLKLTPLQRIKKMNAAFNDMIALKAKTRGVTEHEIYRRYIIKRDKNLSKLLKSQKIREEEPEDENLLIR